MNATNFSSDFSAFEAVETIYASLSKKARCAHDQFDAWSPSLSLGTAALVFLSFICLVPISTWGKTRSVWVAARRSEKETGLPPTVPYAIPFVGNTLDIVFRPLPFLLAATRAHGKPTPFAVKILSSRFHFLQGAPNVMSLWKASHHMAGMTAQIFCLRYLFGMPENGLTMYLRDDSGFHDKPHPNSTVVYEDRVDYQTHVSLLNFTGGKRLGGFYDRWQRLFVQRLRGLDVQHGWIEGSGFLALYEKEFVSAVVEATCGPILERVNPDFTKDLALYQRHTPSLSKGLPRRLVPEAYAIRDKLLGNIKEWHRIAEVSFDPSSIDADGDADPYWGSEFMRGRQEMFKTFHGFDAGAAASSDLGFIWALTFNIVPTSMWVMKEISSDSALLRSIRAELQISGCLEDAAEIDVKTLLTLPRLQGVYAETLRLRLHVIIPRESEHEDLQINGWICPKGSAIVASTHPAHMDATVWNTGIEENHPTDTFWAERFLTFPGDPSSGPCSKKTLVSQPSSEKMGDSPAANPLVSESAPVFNTSSTAGHWFPYGGGPRICPGRHFAKRAILMATAIMIGMFDVEIIGTDQAMQMDSAGFGLGMQRPKGEIAYRIRRR